MSIYEVMKLSIAEEGDTVVYPSAQIEIMFILINSLQ